MTTRFTLFYAPSPEQLRDTTHRLHFEFGQIDVWSVDDIDNGARFISFNSPCGYIPIVSSSETGAYHVFESAWLKAKSTFPELVTDHTYQDFLKVWRAVPAAVVLEELRAT